MTWVTDNKPKPTNTKISGQPGRSGIRLKAPRRPSSRKDHHQQSGIARTQPASILQIKRNHYINKEVGRKINKAVIKLMVKILFLKIPKEINGEAAFFSTFKKLTKAITEITNSTRGLDGKATFLPQKIVPKG